MRRDGAVGETPREAMGGIGQSAMWSRSVSNCRVDAMSSRSAREVKESCRRFVVDAIGYESTAGMDSSGDKA